MFYTHPQRCSMWDPTQIFFTSKLSYLPFSNWPIKTGSANRWETTNSKARGPMKNGEHSQTITKFNTSSWSMRYINWFRWIVINWSWPFIVSSLCLWDMRKILLQGQMPSIGTLSTYPFHQKAKVSKKYKNKANRKSVFPFQSCHKLKSKKGKMTNKVGKTTKGSWPMAKHSQNTPYTTSFSGQYSPHPRLS